MCEGMSAGEEKEMRRVRKGREREVKEDRRIRKKESERGMRGLLGHIFFLFLTVILATCGGREDGERKRREKEGG